MKYGSCHRQRPLQKLGTHLAHWSLLAIDQDAVLNCLLAAVNADYFDRFVSGARWLVMAVHASARRTDAVACM
jgi:hypothetical protein